MVYLLFKVTSISPSPLIFNQNYVCLLDALELFIELFVSILMLFFVNKKEPILYKWDHLGGKWNIRIDFLWGSDHLYGWGLAELKIIKTPISRNRTSDLRITTELYSPPLYQLSYDRILINHDLITLNTSLNWFPLSQKYHIQSKTNTKLDILDQRMIVYQPDMII